MKCEIGVEVEETLGRDCIQDSVVAFLIYV